MIILKGINRKWLVPIFFAFFQNHLTFSAFPHVISRKINFSAKVPSKRPLKLAISEGIFHFCEKNLQKRVGKYCFQRFIGRGTIIFQKFFKIMSVFVRPSTEYVKGLMKLKEKMIKMQKNITILLHHVKSFDFSN